MFKRFKKEDTEKRFCLRANELDLLVKSFGVKQLKDFINETGIEPEEFFYLLRNGSLAVETPKRTANEVTAVLKEGFAVFMRKEFNYLLGEEPCTVERRFKMLLEMATRNGDNMPELLLTWDRYFAPDQCISNDLYETYDFQRSENVIMYILDNIGLPPLQLESIKYYLKSSTVFELTDYEEELLKVAGRNLLSCDKKICSRLDEILKS